MSEDENVQEEYQEEQGKTFDLDFVKESCLDSLFVTTDHGVQTTISDNGSSWSKVIKDYSVPSASITTNANSPSIVTADTADSTVYQNDNIQQATWGYTTFEFDQPYKAAWTTPSPADYIQLETIINKARETVDRTMMAEYTEHVKHDQQFDIPPNNKQTLLCALNVIATSIDCGTTQLSLAMSQYNPPINIDANEDMFQNMEIPEESIEDFINDPDSFAASVVDSIQRHGYSVSEDDEVELMKILNQRAKELENRNDVLPDHQKQNSKNNKSPKDQFEQTMEEIFKDF